jgi:hypothetical protein
MRVPSEFLIFITKTGDLPREVPPHGSPQPQRHYGNATDKVLDLIFV